MVTKTDAHVEVVRMFVGLVCLIFGGATVVSLFFDGIGGAMLFYGIAPGLIFFFSTVVLLPLMYIAVGKQWSLANEEFGVMVASKNKFIQEIQSRVDKSKSTFLTQEIVDAKLRALALNVEELFIVEIELQEDKDEEQLSEIATRISKVKSEFWSAHNLASYLGFKVHPKISDYTKNQ